MDSERGWGEILLTAGLHGAIYVLVKKLSTAASPSGRARKPESGQPVHSSNLTSRLTTAKLKPLSIRPGDRAAPELVIYSAAISAR
jgi:hypothetical protein